MPSTYLGCGKTFKLNQNHSTSMGSSSSVIVMGWMHWVHMGVGGVVGCQVQISRKSGSQVVS